MNASNEQVPELEVPERLQHLIKYCEKSCVAGCCGVDAFDFSPLHVASWLSSYTGTIDARELETWKGLLDEFEHNLESLGTLGGDGLICRISSMNQQFTDEAIRALIAELRTSVAASPAVLELSNQLESPVHAWKLMKDHAARQRPKLP